MNLCRFARVLGFAALLAALASPLSALPGEVHARLVRFDRALQGAFAALSLGAPAPASEERRALRSALLALDDEISEMAESPEREALRAKCRLLLRRVAELDGAARAATPVPAKVPRPAPLVGLAGGPETALAPPANDACANALALTLGTPVTGSLAESTNDGQSSCGSSLFAPDVWLRFDPANYAYYSLDTLGSNFDTVVSLHGSCPGTLQNEEICNDDGLGLASSLAFYGSPGRSVWIRVAGYGGDTGLYQVRVGTGGTVTGIVRAGDTNAPRAGVSVHLYLGNSTYPEHSTTSGADGRYTFADVRAGLYRVWTASSGDYLATPHGGCPNGAEQCPITAAPSITVGATGTATGIDILTRRGGAITGRVTRTNGTGFAGVRVLAWDPADSENLLLADSDANGNYRLAPLPAGSFTVYTDEVGAANEAWPNLPCGSQYYCGDLGTPIAVPAGGTAPGIDFALDILGSVAGRVTEQGTGTPLGSIQVTVYSAGGSWVDYSYTDTDGTYSVSGLPAGSYRALVEASYFSNHGSELYRELACIDDCDVTAGTAIPVALNATTANVDFTLSRRGSLSGRVTSQGGTGLNAVWLRLYDANGNLDQSVLTDANGNYSFQSLTAGSYFLRTENSLGWLDELFDDRPCGPRCDVTQGTPIAIRDGQASLAHFSLGVGATITGTVTETGTGVGLGSGSVQLWNSTGQLVKQVSHPTNGSFVLAGLAAGTYFLSTDDNPNHRDELWNDVPCEGSCTVTTGTPIVLGAGGSINRTFVLDRQAVIEGFVVPEGGGQPLAFWDVELYSQAGNYLRSTSTGSNGYYRFEGLEAGSYRLRTDGYGDYVDELHPNLPCEPGCNVTAGGLVTLSAGGSAGVSFSLGPFARIRGTVRQAGTGQALGSASVVAVGPSGQTAGSDSSASDGSYEISVPPGTFAVYARRSGYAYEMWQEQACGYNTYGDPYCDPASGTPVVVGSGGLVTGIDFTLTAHGGLGGSVTDATTGAGIDSRVQVWTAAGIEVESGYTSTAGIFTFGNLPPGTYYLTTDNYDGYIDELWSDLPCLNGPPYGCKVRRGTPVVVASGATTRNLHLRLARFGGTAQTGLAGQVVDALTAAPLVGVTIDVWDSFGTHRGSAVTGPNGSYRLDLSSGQYYVATDNALGYTNQIWPTVPCPGGSAYGGACAPATGTLVTVPATGGVDFELQPPAAIFTDGFESGNLSAWSVTTP